MKKVMLIPSRIGCPSLPATMKGMLHSLPGVDEVTVFYDERALEISYDETKVTPDAMIKTIGEELGLGMIVAPDGHTLTKEDVSLTCPI